MITSLEVGVLIASETAGELCSYRFTEPLVSKLGVKWALQMGFILLAGSTYGFYYASSIKSDSDFLTLAFLAMFVSGIGSGILRSVILIARAQGDQFKHLLPEDRFRWHL